MNLPELSVKRPVFVSCIFLVILVLGALCRSRLDVSLYPNVSYPIVNVIVPYPGAAPQEVEMQVCQPLEEALSALSGIRILRSTNLDSVGIVTAVFSMKQDIRFAEQKIIQIVQSQRQRLPADILTPIVRTVDPSETPVAVLSVSADLPEAQLYDLADREIRPRIEQLPQVGLVSLQGGRKREIQVELDAAKLRAHEMSVGEVVGRLMAAGRNLPAGGISDAEKQRLVRVLGQFESLDEIRKTVIRFVGNESLTTLSSIGEVRDGLEDEKSRVYVNGTRALTLKVFRQSGGNTVSVAQSIQQALADIRADVSPRFKNFKVELVHDGAQPVRDSVKDATDAIFYGVVLTILVVLLFLGSVRSTLITGVALPNSLLGAFVLMWAAGFTVNITSLAALSIAVGLLVDDAIVVRENIFRHLQLGRGPREAAIGGAREVTLAVVATTLVVFSVFAPIAFLQGLIGQFFKEFGLTICFAMAISLLDSLTMAPMLSAYFAARQYRDRPRRRRWYHRIGEAFERLQTKQEQLYLHALDHTLEHPLLVLLAAITVFAASFLVLARIPKTFLPPQQSGEFLVAMETKPGTSLEATDRAAAAVDKKIREHGEIDRTVLTIGGDNGELNQAALLVKLKTAGHRFVSVGEMKEKVRADVARFPSLTSKVQDVIDVGGGAGQPFVLNLNGPDLDRLHAAADALAGKLAKGGNLRDVDTSYRAGATEYRVVIDHRRTDDFGVSSAEVGQELRMMIAGTTPAQFHVADRRYDIRARLKPEQRNLGETFPNLVVPNVNHRLVPLSSIAKLETVAGPSAISRENRQRLIQVSADIDPKGGGLATAMDEARRLLDSGEVKLPPGASYAFAGQTRDFQELLASILLTLGLSIVSMYLVLASLYESFFVPISILLVLPLAVCGAFYALGLTGSPLDIYSTVGCILLLGVAAKNSILLVDYINEGVRAGKDLATAIREAGRVRLRPILMTSFALIAGMIPVAFPAEESAKQRSGMAIAVIGGLITSTLLTLVVIPAAYGFLARFQAFVMRGIRPFLSLVEEEA